MAEKKLKIYLSHVSQDNSIVRKLYERLRADGFMPWMDVIDLEPGQNWEEAMERAIFTSHVIIACLSRTSFEKEGYIQTEYNKIEKITLQKPIDAVFLIPLKLEECPIPDVFRQYQWLNYFEKNGYEKLVESLLKRAKQLKISVATSGKPKSTKQVKSNKKAQRKPQSKTEIYIHGNVNSTSILREKETSVPDIGENAQDNNSKTYQEENPTVNEIIRRFSFNEDALEKHATTDSPIQSTKQDRLDFKLYVNALYSFILSKYTTTPITISIDGVWGTGKSSLMSMLKGRLDPQRGRVRKFFEWCGLFLPRVQWYWRFLWSFLPKAYGKALIALTVRNDVDDNDIHLYFGDSVQLFKNHVAKILDSFSIAPETINQPENEKLDKSARWWAQINANCEPMEPPYHYTIWLNAWKFDNHEEVWASLALATMEQIKQKHGLFWRLRFWWELTFSRFSFWSGLWQVFKQFLVPLLFAIVAAYYNIIIGAFDLQLDAFKQYGNPLLWAGAVISGILSVSSIFKDPFQIPLDKVFDRPNYKDKVKFLSHFEKDFARIVYAATKNGFGWKRSKLVIFIDDLDRCEPPKSADIVEAVNLFLDAEGCVFVIGMDSESVARSIEVKYKDLFERMKAENAGVVSIGRLFLDKIVQIPFSVPRPTPKQIASLVNDALGVKVLSLSLNISLGGGSNSPSAGSIGASDVDAADQVPSTHMEEQKEVSLPISQPRIDAASYAKPEIRAAIFKGTELLADNPRQVKTFINLFRLSVYIANERKIMEEKIIGEQTSGLNLEKLAIWTACSVRWQSLIRHLHTETQITSLRNFLYSMSSAIQPSFNWIEPSKIPAGIKTDYKKWREDEKGSESHWCYLPWEWWLLEPDFLKTIKSMQDLWAPPAIGETDLLEVLLTMTKPIA